MKLVITGSRNWRDVDFIINQLDLIHCQYNVLEVLSGNCPTGADLICEEWAVFNEIKLTKYPANFSLHGKRGAYIRNNQMTIDGDMLVGFCKSETSVGTEMTIKLMREKNKPCTVFYIPLD